MVAYQCQLAEGQQLYLQNQGTQTVITLVNQSATQRQSQRNSIQTGEWRVPPSLFQTRMGMVLVIETEQTQQFIQIQASSLRSLDAAPNLDSATSLPLTPVEDESEMEQQFQPLMPPMKPMEPMKPMKPLF